MSRFARYSLINLLIVSFLGVILRYKGAFSLPFVNYKHLLDAHSHFAFVGWVTMALFTGFVYILQPSDLRVYRYQFWLNQLSSFGMLVSFLFQGYGPVSIAFSSLSMLVSWWFVLQYLRDSRKAGLPSLVLTCIRFSFLFLLLSSMGPFLLAYSKTHHTGIVFYRDAIYLYLHFQYNGWFTFGVMALFFWSVRQELKEGRERLARIFVLLLGGACIPAYCLSLLWSSPPEWIRGIATGSVFLQLAALGVLICLVRRLSRAVGVLWLMSFVAFAVKLVLQALSAIPSLGVFAFGYRPLVIAYLHLVVLGGVTFFLLGFFLSNGLLRARVGLPLFITGVIFNEVVLFWQSGLAFFSRSWSSSSWYLLGASVLMFCGLALFFYGNKKPAWQAGFRVREFGG